MGMALATHSSVSASSLDLSGRSVFVVLPLGVLLVALVGFAMVRLIRAPSVPYLPKWAWAILMLATVPTGAVVYLILAGVAASEQHPRPGSPAPSPQPAPTPQPGQQPPPAATSAQPGVALPTPQRAATSGAHPVLTSDAQPVPLPVSPQSPHAASADPRSADLRPIVTTTGLTRAYGTDAGLFDVDLAVPRGCVYGLVGHNGAGKTTLLSILTGTRRADRGSVELAVARTSVAVCPDVPEFEPWLTAFEVVDLARHLVAPDLGPAAVTEALATAGLADAADRRVGGFSRGMTQRLGLAAAIVGDPELLILDEPTSALDPAGRAEVLDLVAAMRGRRTIVFSSHILADVQRVADQVGVLRNGRMLYQGSTAALVDQYLSPRWSIRLGGVSDPVEPGSGAGGSSGVETVAEALLAEPWTREVTVVGGDRLTVEADTMEHGEVGIPAVLAASNARLVACEPLAADLESAFLALTSAKES